MSSPDEASHVLVLFDRDRDGEREINKIYGPMPEGEATMLAETLASMATVSYEVRPIEKSPLMVTDAGRQAARTRAR